jgi:RNA polymerase sigma-70 factor (ECF subfamily)
MATTANETIIAKMTDGPRRNTLWIASKGVKEEKSDGDSLAAVVTACQNGDREAYRQLYDSCHRSVFRVSVRMVGLQDAADVTQQVFLQVFRSMGQFNGRSRFETWLYRLAVNESLQYLRRNRRRKYQALDWEPMDETPHGEYVERMELLEQALARVDPQLRSIFLLREVEGLSYHDIAEALEIPEGTVGSRLNRARRELQQVLSDLGFELP